MFQKGTDIKHFSRYSFYELTRPETGDSWGAEQNYHPGILVSLLCRRIQNPTWSKLNKSLLSTHLGEDKISCESSLFIVLWQMLRTAYMNSRGRDLRSAQM